MKRTEDVPSVLNIILCRFRSKTWHLYLNAEIIFPTDNAQHLMDVREILKLLSAADVTVNGKIRYIPNDYLGHTTLSGKLDVSEQPTKDSGKAPFWTDFTKFRSFLRDCNVNRRFLQVIAGVPSR